MKQALPDISVKKIQNGYSLEFEGMKQQNGYMYFSVDKLIEGFMMHIGLGFGSELQVDDMKEFILTANRWNDNKECVTEIKRLTALSKRQENLLLYSERNMLKMRKKMLLILDLVKTAIKEEDAGAKKKCLQDVVRAIGNVKAITKKEQEIIDTPDENEADDEDE